MAVNLSDIVGSLPALTARQRQQTEQIASTQFEQGELGREIARNMFEVAERRERVEMTQLTGQLEAQQQSRRIARAAGMDASASNEIITQLSEQMRQDMLSYQAASQEQQRIQENGNLLSNPLGWLNAVLNGPEVDARVDATAERLQQTAAQLNNAHSLTQANVQTQNAIAETMTQDSIRDATRANALLAESEALQAEQQSLQYSIEGINTLREFGSVEFNRRLQVYNQAATAQRHAQQMEMQQAQLQLQRRRMEAEEEQFNAWEHVADNVNTSRQAQGLEPIPLGVIRQQYGQNTPQGQMLVQMDMLGQASRDRGSAVLGLNPGHTWQMLSQTGGQLPSNLDEDATVAFEAAQRAVSEQIAQARAFQTSAQSTDLGLNKDNVDDPGVVADVFNQVYRQELGSRDANFEAYQIPLENLEAEVPAIRETPFYQTVVSPLKEAGADMTINDIARRTGEAYSRGEIGATEAGEGLSQLWGLHLDMYNALNGRTAIGAPLLDSVQPRLTVGQRSNIRLRGPNTDVVNMNFRNRDITMQTDLRSPTNAIHFLQRYSSNAVSRAMQEGASQGRSN